MRSLSSKLHVNGLVDRRPAKMSLQIVFPSLVQTSPGKKAPSCAGSGRTAAEAKTVALFTSLQVIFNQKIYLNLIILFPEEMKRISIAKSAFSQTSRQQKRSSTSSNLEALSTLDKEKLDKLAYLAKRL